MASTRREKPTENGHLLGTLVSKALDLLSLGDQLLSKVAQTAEKRAAAYTTRLALLFVLMLWISVGLFLSLLGLFYLLIDSAGVPRGLVFAMGGVILSLIALLLLKFAKDQGD